MFGANKANAELFKEILALSVKSLKTDEQRFELLKSVRKEAEGIQGVSKKL